MAFRRHLPVLLLLAIAPLLAAQATAQREADAPPTLPREFRGVWVATVLNLDWPSARGLSTDQQKRELLAILDKARDLNLNAVVLQVRPAGDALYRSSHEPWSAYLTGTMGKAPEPFYDPLAFAVEEAHRRGLELHAWLNPYRATTGGGAPAAANHIARRRPDLVVKYGDQLIMNPGEQEVIDYNVSVVMDVVTRYDIDGVHFDDYFYPYPRNGESFGDADTYQRYRQGGGRLSLEDWRRDNVDRFIQRTYTEIKRAKPHVKFGISPFGIWKSGQPSQIRGLSAHDVLYADSRKWLQEGWVDYLSPQLYWPTSKREQSFPVLLDWWLQQNPKGRHVWPGLATYKVGDDAAYTTAEIVSQIRETMRRSASRGHVHFRAQWLTQNRGKIADVLKRDAYPTKALVPPMPWIDSTPPAAPQVAYVPGNPGGSPSVHWKSADGKPVKNWVVSARQPTGWWVEILPGNQTSLRLKSGAGMQAVAVSAVDLAGNEGPQAMVRLQ